ncbi:MAG: 2-(1,2-epoxy-1,2-dihydrophenyl)acetyl-CoA isomerase PaaG [Pseudomonadota bacterium]
MPNETPSAPENQTVLVSQTDGLVTITLNRPDKLNAFTVEMNRALQVALGTAAQSESCRAILLTGAGRGFCAGQDLADPAATAEGGLGDLLGDLFNPLVRLIRSTEKPIICAVNGVAAGAGANVALACDIVLAAKSAKFIQAFSKIALIPDCGGTWFLPKLIGEARAKALAMTAAPVSAEQAMDWGMIWKAVEDDALMAEAEALAQSLANGPTYALALMKEAIQAAGHEGLNAQLEMERDLQVKAGNSPDYAEGVAAFSEKRAPRFTGKAS